MSLSGVCDLDAVLNALEGDRELLSRMIDVFLQESPTLRDRTRQALAARDARALERAAHTLRGALANFGAKQAGGTAQRLEHSAAGGDWNAALAAHASLEKEMEDVASSLAAFSTGTSK